MDFTFSTEDELFREEVRTWLREHLVGDFAALGTGNDMGGPEELAVRKAWERELAAGGWVGLSWPKAFGGREAGVGGEGDGEPGAGGGTVHRRDHRLRQAVDALHQPRRARLPGEAELHAAESG